MIALARIISTVFSPYILLLPTPFLLIYKTTGQAGYALEWTIFTGLFIGLLLAITLYGVRKGHYTDIDLSNRKQRQGWYLIFAALSFLYFCAVIVLKGPSILVVGVIGLIMTLIIMSLINTKVKASIHLATISAMIFAIGIFYGGFQLLWLLLIPLVAWSRVKIHRHTVREVAVGAIVGSALTLLMYFVFKYMIVLPG